MVKRFRKFVESMGGNPTKANPMPEPPEDEPDGHPATRTRTARHPPTRRQGTPANGPARARPYAIGRRSPPVASRPGTPRSDGPAPDGRATDGPATRRPVGPGGNVQGRAPGSVQGNARRPDGPARTMDGPAMTVVTVTTDSDATL